MNNKEFNRKILASIRRNVDAISEGGRINELRGKYTGQSVVIAGAGPSLEMNTALVKESGCVVFACDRARDRLVRAGVRPEFTVTTDPSPATGLFIAEPGIADEILLASTYASAEILAHDWKKVLFYNTASDDHEYMDEVMRICRGVDFVLGGILVSNFAMLLAEYMGFAKIAFIGCDFCSPEPEPDWIGSENYYHLQLEDGRSYHTLKSFLAALDWLDKYLAHQKTKPHAPHVFNCSEAGIMYSDNIKRKQLEEILTA